MKTTIINNLKMNYIGDLNLLKQPCISVAGTRQIDNSSRSWLRNKLKNCKSPIISGLALGTDTVAHELAIEIGVPTIAILPCGLHNITPKSNKTLATKIVKNGGLLISTYDANTPANRDRYIERNKLIAMFGSFLIVPMFDKHSGTRHTVDFTRDLNKTIYVRNKGYSGNQYIINNDSYRTIAI